MNRKQRNLRYIKVKNHLRTLAKGEVNLNRNPKFWGKIGETKDGRVMTQYGDKVLIHDPEPSRISLFPVTEVFKTEIDPSKFVFIDNPVYYNFTKEEE